MATHFEPGQVWRFKARPKDGEALLAILAVRIDDTVGTICSIAMAGVAIDNPYFEDGVQSVMPHAPITAAVLEQNVRELVGNDGPTAETENFKDAYQEWLTLYEKQEAGVFTISPLEILDIIEQSVNTPPEG